MIWTFAAGGKLFAYQSGVLIVGYSYGYFEARDLVRMGAWLTVVEFVDPDAAGAVLLAADRHSLTASRWRRFRCAGCGAHEAAADLARSISGSMLQLIEPVEAHRFDDAVADHDQPRFAVAIEMLMDGERGNIDEVAALPFDCFGAVFPLIFEFSMQSNFRSQCRS